MVFGALNRTTLFSLCRRSVGVDTGPLFRGFSRLSLGPSDAQDLGSIPDAVKSKNNKNTFRTFASGRKGKKMGYYAVHSGRKPGVYTSWPQCEAQVRGYSRAVFKKFDTREEASAFVRGNRSYGPPERRKYGNNSRYNPYGGNAATSTSPDFGRNYVTGKSDSDDQKDASSSHGAPQKTEAFTLHFDGGSRGNPGPAGSGFVISGDSGYKREHYTFLGDRFTNNEAEYNGLLTGLDCILTSKKARDSISHLTIYGDSKLVIQQSLGNWKVNAKHLQPLCEEVKGKLDELKKLGVEVNLEYIPRARNSTADGLANTAMDEGSSSSRVEF